MQGLTGGVAGIPVEGGELAYEIVLGATEPVLMVHGVSSQRRLWDWLHAEDPDLTIIAPDLRGRGDSASITGPFGLIQHVEDLVALLDALGLDSVVVCGMSMGAFVAVELAAARPERVRSLVLVDGGFPMVAPPGLTREMVPALFRDRLQRLEQPWPDLDEYVRFVVGNTAPLLDPEDPLLRGNLAHDLVDGRARLVGQALIEDAADIFVGPSSWMQVSCPIRWLPAQWSIGRDSAPAYPPDLIERYRPHCVEVEFLPELDHAGSIMTRRGAGRVAVLVRSSLAGSEPTPADSPPPNGER